MAYNTRALLRDVNGFPIPQYYDPDADAFKPLLKGTGAIEVLESVLPEGAATEDKQDVLNNLIGEATQSPTENTLLARVKSLEDKIEGIINGTTPAFTSLSGNKSDHGLLIYRPDADEVPEGFMYFAVDATQKENRLCYSDGINWQEVSS